MNDLQENGQENERFVIVKEMDLGIDFIVVAAKDKAFANHPVCILQLPRRKWVSDWVKQSLSKRCCLLHPHIIRIYNIVVCECDLCVIFEHPKGENLLDLLMKCRLSQAIARNLFQQLIFVLDYYHDNGIDGLDLTLERIFYSHESGVLKVVDFGFCNNTEDGAQMFSLPFVAPEQIENSFHVVDRKATDIWRCGVLLYCMLFRAFPFCPGNKTSVQDHISSILRGRWSIPNGEKLSHPCFDLLQKLLIVDPVKRIKLAQIKEHPWYRMDLPDGVLQYKHLSRPADGLSERLGDIIGKWFPE